MVALQTTSATVGGKQKLNLIPFVNIAQPDAITCQSTCIANVLAPQMFKDPVASVGQYVPQIRYKLDSIGSAGDPSVMSQVIKRELARSSKPVSMTYQFFSDYSINDVLNVLNQGGLVIVHGWFTRSGHVILLTGSQANPTALDTSFRVVDPWSEFNGATFQYDLGKVGFTGFYSKRLIWATCVESVSWDNARSLYRGGSVNSNTKNIWAHVFLPIIK